MKLDELNEELQKRFVAMAARNGRFGLTFADSNKPFANLFGKTSVIAILIYVVAAAIWAKDTLFADWLDAVEQTADGTRYGTYRWWVNAAKKFQVNSQTSVIDGFVGYETIDESKQIITAATVIQDGRNLTVKVAKSDGNNGLEKLTTNELMQFRAYVQNIKPIGIVANVESKPAAQVRLVATVRYNAAKSEDDIKQEVEDAVSEYLANLGFGGTLYVSRIIEAIMDIDGVLDVRVPILGGVVVDGRVIQNSTVPSAGYAMLSDTNITVIADYDRGR